MRETQNVIDFPKNLKVVLNTVKVRTVYISNYKEIFMNSNHKVDLYQFWGNTLQSGRNVVLSNPFIFSVVKCSFANMDISNEVSSTFSISEQVKEYGFGYHYVNGDRVLFYNKHLNHIMTSINRNFLNISNGVAPTNLTSTQNSEALEIYTDIIKGLNALRLNFDNNMLNPQESLNPLIYEQEFKSLETNFNKSLIEHRTQIINYRNQVLSQMEKDVSGYSFNNK